jgi:hypothetical protein
MVLNLLLMDCGRLGRSFHYDMRRLAAESAVYWSSASVAER